MKSGGLKDRQQKEILWGVHLKANASLPYMDFMWTLYGVTQGALPVYSVGSSMITRGAI